MGLRRWSFVEEPVSEPVRPAWRFAWGYLATLAIVAGAVTLMLR
jgi:hypothetical protein